MKRFLSFFSSLCRYFFLYSSRAVGWTDCFRASYCCCSWAYFSCKEQISSLCMAIVLTMVSQGRTFSSYLSSNCLMESLEGDSCMILLIISCKLTQAKSAPQVCIFQQYFQMLSDQQLRSLVRIDDPEQQNSQTEPVLDLSHKQLRKLKEIQLSALKVGRVDASYNYFKSFHDLNFKEVNEKMAVPVSWLDISFNYFSRIDESAESAHVLQYLKHLNISANRLQAVDFSALEVPQLEFLNISNNQIQFFLDCPASLRALIMDHNRISALAFKGGGHLSVLSARNNIIKGLGVHLPHLLLLDLQGNKVEQLDAVKELVQQSKELLSINFRQNPVSSINNYRLTLLEHCQNITQIDDVVISPHIREGYKILKSQEKLEEMMEQANRKYADRLAQKQRVKEELLKKMQDQQKLIEERFQKGIDEERGQFEELEKQAKDILGKKRLNITEQKDQFASKVNAYSNIEEQPQPFVQKISSVQGQHLSQYLQFLKRRPVKSSSSERKIVDKRKGSHSKTIEIRQQFKGIVMFDVKCIDSLLENYHVDQF